MISVRQHARLQVIEVAVIDRDRLARQAPEPLDVVHRRLPLLWGLGELEDDDVAAVRHAGTAEMAVVEWELVNEHAIAAAVAGRLTERADDAALWIGFLPDLLETAVRA